MPKVVTKFKVLARGGQATPGPPIGPTLGQHGVNIGQFINTFNTETKDRMGELIPTIVTVFDDKSFSLTYKIAPVSELIKTELKIQKGSQKPGTEKIGKMTREQIKRVAEKKLPDLNTTDLEAAMRLVAGTAKQMGLIPEL